MALIALKCPNCSGEVEFDENMHFGFCIYCGTKLLNDPETARMKIDHEDEIRGKLELAVMSLRAKEFERVTFLLDEVISLDPRASDAWLMKSLLYEPPLSYECIQKARAEGSNSYGVFTEGSLPGKAFPEYYSVVFELRGNIPRNVSELHITIDFDRHILKASPDSSLEVLISAGNHPLVISEGTLGTEAQRMFGTQNVLHVMDDSRITLIRGTFGWKIADCTGSIIKKASLF